MNIDQKLFQRNGWRAGFDFLDVVGHFRRQTTQLPSAMPSRRFPRPWKVEPMPKAKGVLRHATVKQLITD
jgi:hypothetical protein